MHSFEKIRSRIKKSLDPGRYEHTVGVVYTAASLAMCHGEDIDKAMMAGLLHDCAKSFPGEEMIAMCDKYHLPVSKTEKENPGLLHAKLGACLAKEVYGIADCDILDAIKCHTTGKSSMSKLDKILYIADYIEPSRKKAPNLEEIRRMAFRNLNECLIRILDATIEYVSSGNLAIDPATVSAREYYKKASKN